MKTIVQEQKDKYGELKVEFVEFDVSAFIWLTTTRCENVPGKGALAHSICSCYRHIPHFDPVDPQYGEYWNCHSWIWVDFDHGRNEHIHYQMKMNAIEEFPPIPKRLYDLYLEHRDEN